MSNFTHFYWAKILASAEGNQSGHYKTQGTVSEESAKMTKRELLRGKMQIPRGRDPSGRSQDLIFTTETKQSQSHKKNWIPTKYVIPTNN